MSRIAATFARLRAGGDKGLVTFITAGDPEIKATVPALRCLVEGGADILELGVPFTDPEAEGPSIQRSSERGVQNGVTLKKTCELVREFRVHDADTPVLLMGYFNPILAMGVARFAAMAEECGVDGVIVVNLPPEEADSLTAELAPRGIDLIFLIAPTTRVERVKALAAKATGFLYYVSIKGITGADHLDVVDVERRVETIKALTDTPVAVGFGVKTPASAAAVAKVADAVVVGSALVDIMGNGDALPETLDSLRQLTNALKNSTRGA